MDEFFSLATKPRHIFALDCDGNFVQNALKNASDGASSQSEVEGNTWPATSLQQYNEGVQYTGCC